MTMTLIPTAVLEVLLDRLPIAYDAQNDEPLYEAITAAQGYMKHLVSPIVVANITGGVLQGASSNYPVEIYALDFEIDPRDDACLQVEGSDAYCYGHSTVVDPGFVKEVLDALDEANRNRYG